MAATYANAVWLCLVAEIADRLDDHEPRSITYGDIRKRLTGSSSGAQSLNNPLLEIARRLSFLQKESALREIPEINAMVVNATSGKPGKSIPNLQPIGPIWDLLRKIQLDGLLTITNDIGFETKAVWRAAAPDPFSSLLLNENNRSRGTWNGFDPGQCTASNVSEFSRNRVAKHSSICAELKKNCEKLGYEVAEKLSIRPDLFVKKNDNSVLFEVKPDFSVALITHAIGQILYYSEHLNPKKMVIVTPEGKKMDSKLYSILNRLNIYWLSCNENHPYFINREFQQIVLED